MGVTDAARDPLGFFLPPSEPHAFSTGRGGPRERGRKTPVDVSLSEDHGRGAEGRGATAVMEIGGRFVAVLCCVWRLVWGGGRYSRPSLALCGGGGGGGGGDVSCEMLVCRRVEVAGEEDVMCRVCVYACVSVYSDVVVVVKWDSRVVGKLGKCGLVWVVSGFSILVDGQRRNVVSPTDFYTWRGGKRGGCNEQRRTTTTKRRTNE